MLQQGDHTDFQRASYFSKSTFPHSFFFLSPRDTIGFPIFLLPSLLPTYPPIYLYLFSCFLLPSPWQPLQGDTESDPLTQWLLLMLAGLLAFAWTTALIYGGMKLHELDVSWHCEVTPAYIPTQKWCHNIVRHQFSLPFCSCCSSEEQRETRGWKWEISEDNLGPPSCWPSCMVAARLGYMGWVVGFWFSLPGLFLTRLRRYNKIVVAV